MSIVHVAFYPSDWLAGTRGLSAEESGVYITLICRIYEMAGPIERDDDRLSRLCGCKSKAAFVKALEYLIAEGKIIVTEDGLTNERCEREIENTTEKSGKAKAAAQSRWNKKPKKNKEGTDADASSKHMPERCQSESEPYKKVGADAPTVRSGRPERFDEFWDVFPHRHGAKKGRAPCEKKYAAAVKAGVPEQSIIDAARAYQSDADVLRGYGKGPEPWLNQKGWEDEIAQTQQLQLINGGPDDQQPTSKSQRKIRAWTEGARGTFGSS